ncbi:MAG TPA: kelch repeat-containing protein [Candidatus Sulfotelmatobacter sp.]|nr:kelch repeat-containing protein [Candidatus Sulfotelmatobacter sp.]
MNSRTFVLVGTIAAILVGLGCGGGNIGTKITPNYTISVSVTGLNGTLVLQDNGANNLSVTANGNDSFTTQIAAGGAYNVTILTQPTGETCSLGSNAQGTANSNVTVAVTCSATTYTVSVSVTGLTGTGLVFQDNGGDNLSVTADGTFPFATQIASGGPYAVTILTQPSGQTCTIINGSGTATGNVTVAVTCSVAMYTISASVSGLTGTGLVLQDNGTNNLSITGNGTFPFTTQVASGGTYAVTILTQPSGQSCTLGSNASGTATANVTVAVTCSTTTYTISVSVSGLTGTGLVLQDNGTNNLSITGNGTFPFTTPIASGAAYAVTILTPPSGQTCTLGSNASGTATGNVTVAATCSATMYTISVLVSGLTGTGLQFQDNGGDNLSVNANGTFPFATKIPSGGNYAVTILAQPSGQTCALGSNASGTATANVTVAVTCTSTLYTISVAVSGLTGTGLVFQDNGADNLSVTTNGTFPFATQVASGNTYAVTVLTQPTGQTCTPGSNASGTATANVTVAVTCVAANYTIGGTVSGLTATMILQDTGSNGTQTVTVLSGATTFTFPTAVPSGSTYSVIVSSQPTGENCTVANGSGTASANVTNIAVTCTTAYTVGGTITGLTGTMTLLDTSTGGNQTVTATSGASTFTFPTAVATGTGYAVTVQTQPSGQTCTVTNGTGTVANANVTNIAVSCTGTVTYTIGGSITGLTGTMTLTDTGSNGNQNVTVNSGATSFTFPTNVPSGSTYNVTVLTQPTGETCTVAGGQGTATGNVTTISVTCGSGSTFTLGGTIYDLSANPSSTGVVLEYNNANSETFVTNGTFAFSTPIAAGTAYTVAVKTQPSGPAQNCTVNNATGTANADVTNLQVVCIGEWTWINGADVVAQNGTYVTKGSYGGDPGARYEVNSWIDASGNMWLFGGDGYAGDPGPESELPDLWKFTPGGPAGGWEWVAGANTTRDECSIYPTNGIGFSGTPGARSLSTNWIDSSGNLWMFGGYVEDTPAGLCQTADPFNDVWEYQQSTKSWIWWGPTNSTLQNQPGVYTSIGGTGGTPGSRYGSAGAVDSSGNFWVFGGYGIDGSNNPGYLNDIWEYTPSSNTWTWWGGSQVHDANETASTPGARVGASAWIDSSGNFWVFGGIADGSDGVTGDMNDLWEFSLSTHSWTLVAGSETSGGATATYGTQGIPDSANLPGPRVWTTIFQTPNGDVWLYGGTTSRGDFYNDLWKYSGGEWTWMDGSQGPNYDVGVYQTPPLAPGARYAGGSWADSSGNLWMFGGFGVASVPTAYDSMNDLWEFQP